MFYLVLILPFLLAYLVLGFNPIRLTRNYLIARKSNFPLLLTPAHPNHIPWTLLGVPIRPLLRRYLPTSLFSRLNLTTYGYEFTEKTSTHDRIGKSFMLVTSGSNELNIADPDLAMEILRRPKEFRQTLIGSKVMRIFGDNLITSDGEHWSRQRKLVASNVNEKISGLVWKEAAIQTREMMDAYIHDQGGVTDDYAEGLKIVAINVLGVAGYGVRTSWRESLKAAGNIQTEPAATEKTGSDRGKQFKLTYIQATRYAIDHIVEASLVPTWIFLLEWMPEGVKKIGYAKQEFAAHTQGMLDRERQRQTDGDRSEKTNMLSMLVKESDSSGGGSGGEGDEKSERKAAGLTEDEIMGNLFVFTAAGFDTTANTMTYAVTLLAAYPEWQDWLAEELDEEKKFITLTVNFQMETLRIFAPVVHIAKGTPTALPSPGYISVTHPVTKLEYRIADNTLIYINSVAVQHDPEIYGADADTFRPSRFLETVILDDGTESTRVKSFGKGTFLSWSAGPRVCPGMKMSQVEFVSVFMTVFRRFRVELVRRDDGSAGGGGRETMEMARDRVEGVMADSQSRLTLQMNRPREVKVRFVDR